MATSEPPPVSDEEGWVAAVYDDATGKFKGTADAEGKVDGYRFVHSSRADAERAADRHDRENPGDVTDIERPGQH